MPSGGDGYYYIFAYFRVVHYENAGFDIQINGETLCSAWTDNEDAFDHSQAVCGAATYATEGL